MKNQSNYLHYNNKIMKIFKYLINKKIFNKIYKYKKKRIKRKYYKFKFNKRKNFTKNLLLMENNVK